MCASLFPHPLQVHTVAHARWVAPPPSHALLHVATPRRLPTDDRRGAGYPFLDLVVSKSRENADGFSPVWHSQIYNIFTRVNTTFRYLKRKTITFRRVRALATAENTGLRESLVDDVLLLAALFHDVTASSFSASWFSAAFEEMGLRR